MWGWHRQPFLILVLLAPIGQMCDVDWRKMREMTMQPLSCFDFEMVLEPETIAVLVERCMLDHPLVLEEQTGSLQRVGQVVMKSVNDSRNHWLWGNDINVGYRSSFV